MSIFIYILFNVMYSISVYANKKRSCILYILYTYIANIQLIASTPQPRHDQFNCWWRFPVSSLVPLTYFQLNVLYYFLLASGLKYLPPSEKLISSIGYKSNNCLLNETLSTPPTCSYVIWTRERKKEANSTFRSCVIKILKTAQFWQGVAFLYAYTSVYASHFHVHSMLRQDVN